MCDSRAAGPAEDADSAYQRGDYALAERLFRPLAERGDAKAQFYLGWMYYLGLRVTQDALESARWYREAAEQGDAKAQFNLGLMYDYGPRAQLHYGYDEIFLPDAQEAVRWYRMAAKQGIVWAQLNLSGMYADGNGVSQNFVRAHMWINVAAAISSGEIGKDARRNRDELASQMTATQIEKAQEMARRCQKTKFEECD